jgi:hypothetical protein
MSMASRVEITSWEPRAGGCASGLSAGLWVWLRGYPWHAEVVAPRHSWGTLPRVDGGQVARAFGLGRPVSDPAVAASGQMGSTP